ncbi:MAG: heavy metal sensor histidine kinase [Lysobacteraceae bacterium]
MPEANTRPRRPASLALRVIALVGISMALVLIGFNWISARALDRHFVEMDEAELRAVAAAVFRTLEATPADEIPDLQPAVRGHHGVHFLLLDPALRDAPASRHGPDLARFAAGVPPVDPDGHWPLAVWEEGGTHYRGTVVALAHPPGLRLAVAMDIDTHEHFTREFRRIQRWTFVLAMALVVAVAWLAVRWGHAPIRRTNERIRAISSSRLYLRLDPDAVPVELGETLVAFNDLLARLEDGFAQLANFSADIAHELRTPVTNLTTQTEVALGQARSAEEYREILYSNLEEFGRLNRMINDMLFLAQTENAPDALRREEVDLAATLRDLFDYFEAWCEERGVLLELSGDAAPAWGDREMLRRALGNLLSNAIRYTPAGGCVGVTLAQQDGRVRLVIANPGPVIPAADLPRLFNRFYRVDPSRQKQGAGAGLGLAIVKSIVEAHGGRVDVASDEASTRFSVVLPQAKR